MLGIYILFVSCLFVPKFCWLFLIHFCQCSAVNCVVFLTVWGKFSWLLHCYCFKFSFLVLLLLVLRVCWFVPVGQNNLLALLPISHLLLTFLLCLLPFFPILTWLFVNKFCLELLLLTVSIWVGLVFKRRFFFFVKIYQLI